VPTLTVPTLGAPQSPTLQTPEFPVLPVPSLPPLTFPSQESTAGRTRTRTAATTPAVLQPNVVDPQVLLNTLQGPEEPTVELVAPQEATTDGRLPTRTIAIVGGGAALVWFALSLLRRRDDDPAHSTSTDAAA
jgi:hypothetical protein